MNKSLRLTESAVMVAIAFVLSLLKVIDMPFGGSVTAFSMLPIAIIAYRYNTAWGAFAGLTYGVLQLVMGLKNLSYATSAAAVIGIILLDYLIAYMMIGLSGVFKKRIKDHGNALAIGVFIACFARYICHVVVGCVVWAEISIPSAIFSFAYNAAYMVPETLITVTGAYFAGKVFTLTEPQVKRVPMEKNALANIYTALPISIGAVISFAMLFSMMQNEDGFDITAVASANIYKWISLAAVFALGLVIALILRRTLKQNSKITD